MEMKNERESMKQLKDVFHEHHQPLVFNKEPWDQSKFTRCSACKNPLSGESYNCAECDEFYLHKRCAEAPFEINHLHRKHDHLTLQSSIIERSEGRYVSHVCVQCHLQVHQDCTLLPRYIKFLMHRHPLSHKYFLENMEHQKLDCRLCHEEVKTEHGSYSCLKQDCDYVIHVKCVTLDTDIYEVIDPNEIEDLLKDEPVESCITCVIERNESGEAIKIKHLFHEHELMLMEDKIKEEDVDDDDDHKQCNGCTGSISTSFYYCSRYPQCNFLLHKSCAELPRTWDGWLLSYPFTLRSEGIFKCYPCGQQCSGFFYKYYEEEYSLVLCLRCAKISDTFEYPGHQHFLFYDIQNELGWEGKCTACGSESRGERPFFTCKHDDVALEYKCMTLPHATRHKCDKHLLQLMYRDQSDDPIQHDCDICEEGRDPNHWFYHCSICDNSVHPRCVLGEYPFIKIGSMYEHKDHPHPLTFVQKIYYYPKCAICGDHCLDLSLECASCNYIVHWKCISRSRS
ncbi:C1-like protein [Corchorus olitorius]|uniref:C1-like protein n=1 Tax=Corchorus olitorius TaxID=93759 RepID=A0A1R3KAS0_9ROSI|nr:C1-like protein [Corchorus olitorius]